MMNDKMELQGWAIEINNCETKNGWMMVSRDVVVGGSRVEGKL